MYKADAVLIIVIIIMGLWEFFSDKLLPEKAKEIIAIIVGCIGIILLFPKINVSSAVVIIWASLMFVLIYFCRHFVGRYWTSNIKNLSFKDMKKSDWLNVVFYLGLCYIMLAIEMRR